MMPGSDKDDCKGASQLFTGLTGVLRLTMFTVTSTAQQAASDSALIVRVKYETQAPTTCLA